MKFNIIPLDRDCVDLQEIVDKINEIIDENDKQNNELDSLKYKN